MSGFTHEELDALIRSSVAVQELEPHVRERLVQTIHRLLALQGDVDEATMHRAIEEEYAAVQAVRAEHRRRAR